MKRRQDRLGPTLSGLYCRQIAPPHVPGTRTINVLSALAAIAIGVVHAGLAPVMAGSDLRPNIMLVAVVVVTMTFGLGPGATWAFLGGLTANLLTTDPLGSVPLGLLAAAAAAAAVCRATGRVGAVVAMAAGIVGSVAFGLTVLLAMLFVGGDPPALDAGSVSAALVPSAVLNGLLAATAWLAGRGLAQRLGYATAGD